MSKQERIKEDILYKALKNIPFDGWSDNVLEGAVENLGYEKGYAYVLFPQGVTDFVNYFSDYVDSLMLDKISAMPNDMRTNEKIISAIMFRINEYSKNKEAIRKLLSFYSLPLNCHQGIGNSAKTVDKIWYAVGDKATDFNYYTKRFLLYLVYSNTILYWLSDTSRNHIDTENFLRRRINDVMKVGKIKKGINEKVSKLSKYFNLSK